MATVLFTGFPGFLGSALLPRVLERPGGHRAVCLVQEKFAALADGRRRELEQRAPQLRGRIELVTGDITESGLGLRSGTDALARDLVEVYHLAAVYDLDVRREVAVRVNVDGTRHVLEFAGRCAKLERFHHVSTCYVSGRHAGVFREDDLVRGQKFNNHYEETKYLAEVEVQDRMRRGLPATIYRPSIVVGDSGTGATVKYDGPYSVLRWLMRQPRLALLPVVGDPASARVNVVPRDFIVDAIAYLGQLDRSKGQVYQLADPAPPTVSEWLDVVGQALDRRILRVPLPASVAKAAIEWVPGVYRLMQIPSAAVDYFAHPTRYACENAVRDLAASGIAVPPFAAYIGRLVDFVRAHPEIGSRAMS